MVTKPSVANRGESTGDRGQLLSSEQRLERYVTCAPLGVIEWDLEFRVVNWNPAAERIFGYHATEAVGRHASFIIPEELRIGLTEVWNSLLSGRGGTRHSNQNTRANGERIECEWYNSPLYDPLGQVIGVLSMVQDVTQERATTQQLQVTLDRTRRINEEFLKLTKQGLLSAPDRKAIFSRITEITSRALGVARVGIWQLSPDGQRLTSEDLFLADTQEHRVGQTLQADVVPRYFTAIQQDHVVAAVDAIRDPRTSEFADNYLRPLTIGAMLDVGVRLDGRLVGVLCCEHVGGSRIWSSEECVFAGAVAEVIALVLETEERRILELKLSQARRMEALGTLASGIAHDFNNLLLAIMGNAELLEHSTGDAASVRKSVDGIRDAAIRARGIVQQILTFGRRSTVRQDPVQLSRILSEVKGVLEHLESDKHRITLDPVPTTLMVPGDASQLHQVFLNLVKNGLDALAESGGAVRIACDVVATPAVPSGSRPTVRITVSDTGSGIPPEVREHIFEPFFTTKGPGRGTGLGLSIVHGIVTSHGGEVGVASVVGAGTTVTVDLPLVRGVPGQAESEPVITSENRQLLLVDDDPSVLAVLVGLVESFGYSARAYDNVDDLLKELERASSDYFAVLTDLRIGARSGEEVVRAVRALSNPPRVFLLSGGLLSQEEFDVDGVPVAVIGKPFSRRELLEALNDPSYQLHTHRQTVQQSK